MACVESFPSLLWIFYEMIGIIGALMTGSMLVDEMRKRNSRTNLLTSEYLKITSAVCLWCGLAAITTFILGGIPGLCYIKYRANAVLIGIQYLFLGLFQLSRLHYCFSKDEKQRQKGYPLWIFIIMASLGCAFCHGLSSSLILSLPLCNVDYH